MNFQDTQCARSILHTCIVARLELLSGRWSGQGSCGHVHQIAVHESLGTDPFNEKRRCIIYAVFREISLGQIDRTDLRVFRNEISKMSLNDEFQISTTFVESAALFAFLSNGNY